MTWRQPVVLFPKRSLMAVLIAMLSTSAVSAKDQKCVGECQRRNREKAGLPETRV